MPEKMNVNPVIEPVKHVRINPFVRECGRLWYKLKQLFLVRHINNTRLEYFNDTPLLCMPDVLYPVVFWSGAYLAGNHTCAPSKQ